jgi:TonB family protein
MNNPARLFLALLTAFALTTGRAQTPAVKPGYAVLVEISYDEKGVPEDGKVVQSDDPTGDHTLEQIALNMAQKDVQPPRVDAAGKPMKFKARRPFDFPVEGDKGDAANVDRPVLRAGHQVLPVYPESMAAQNAVGGAIVELVIRDDGTVRSVKTLRASHPEFAQAAETALKQWLFNPRGGPGRPPESTWHVAVGFSKDGRAVDLKWRLSPRPAIGGFVVARVTAPAAPAATAPVTLPAAPVPAEKK